MRRNLIADQPYLPLLPTCVIVALIAWIRRAYVGDVQIYDTYYVLEMHFLAGILIAIILITGLLYWITRQRTGLPQLTVAHVLGTIGLAIYLISSAGQVTGNADVPVSFGEYKAWQDMNARFGMALIALAAIQILFVVNLMIKWIKG